MAFQLSPGVLVTERDLTSIVPAVSTSAGAFAGLFQWGPVEDPITISSENNLVSQFGKPNDYTAQDFLTASSFLSYTNNLLVSRVRVQGARNSVAEDTGSVSGVTLTSGGTGYSPNTTVTFGLPQVSGGVRTLGAPIITGGVITGFTITEPGSGYTAAPSVTVNDTGSSDLNITFTVAGGSITGYTIVNGGTYYNPATTITIDAPTGAGPIQATASLTIVGGVITGVTITEPGAGYTSAPGYTVAGETGGSGFVGTAVVNSAGGVQINNEDHYTATYANGLGLVGEWAAKFPGTLGDSLSVSMVDGNSWASWASVNIGGTNYDLRQEFNSAPNTSDFVESVNGANDELHIVVIDRLGLWTGTIGTVLEKFAFVSKASDARKSDGSNNYYKDVINANSKYIWWMDHTSAGTNWGDAAGIGNAVTYVNLSSHVTRSLIHGSNGDWEVTAADYISSYDLFKNDEIYDVSLVLAGSPGLQIDGGAVTTVEQHIIDNVVEWRKDCVAFLSPYDLVNKSIILGNDDTAVQKVLAYKNSVGRSTSYAVMDSGFKYMYDRYNDKYRWVPLNGDIAGLCARTDYTNDPWWSPGGLNRGQIKNVVKLATNPGKTERDSLYKNGVNPVVAFPGQGTVLFGDKTMLAKPSAFDRINVRRLFIVLEKAIATASKFQLFEFNDSFTRAQFKNMVEPFLRDVQGRRGIIDFRVKCDESNNTGEVIDRNEFVADIFIKPNRSINFISLNFIAARSAISFDEIGG